MKAQNVGGEPGEGTLGVVPELLPSKCPMPPGWNLTAKQRAAIAAYVTLGNRKQALTVAGYKNVTNSNVFNALLTSPRVRPALAHALRIAGVTDQLKADALAGALRADREYCSEGEVVAGGPDHGTRLKALKIALDLDGDLGGVQVEGSETFESHVQAAQLSGYSEE